MRRRALLAGCGAVLCGGQGRLLRVAPPVSSYVGPGDIVSGATYFWGLRGYNNAGAAPGTTNAVRVVRLSDNAEQDVVILSSGALDMTSATTFAGTDATGTGAIALTALTFTGGTIGDVVTGSGVTAGTFIVSGSSPNWTVNKSQTVTSTTLTLTYGLKVKTIYDQTASGINMTQTTAANQPYLVPGYAPNGTGPGMVFLGGQTLGPANAALAQVLTWGVVAMRNAATTSYNAIMGGSAQIQIGFNNSANSMILSLNTTDSTVAANDNSWHSVQAVANGAASIIYADGTTGTTGSGTSGTATANIGSGNLGGTAYMNGAINQVGLWPSAFSAGNRTSMVANDQAFWGF